MANKYEKGFSLPQVMIVLGVVSIIAAGIASMFTSMSREMVSLHEKTEVQNTKQLTLTMLANQAVCAVNLSAAGAAAPVDISDATTTTASANSIVLNELHVGVTLATPLIARVGQPLPGMAPGQLVVNSIQIKNIFQTGLLNVYKGTLTIDFTVNSTVRAMNPVTIDQIFSIGTPSNAAVINSCVTNVQTIIEIKCNWWSPPGPANCIPTACPAGWTDLGIGSSSVEAANSGSTGGYYSRFCQIDTPYKVVEPKCNWWSPPGLPNCVPAACPAGWTDLGITSSAVQAANTGSTGGYFSRFCVQ